MTIVGEPEVAADGDAELRHRVHRRLVAEGADELAAPGEGVLRRRLSELLRDEQPLLSAARFDALLDALTHEVAGLGPLEPLLADPTVTEVMVNGPGHAYVERRGRLEQIALGLDAAGIVHLVERVVAASMARRPGSCSDRCAPGGTCSWPARPARARPRC